MQNGPGPALAEYRQRRQLFDSHAAAAQRRFLQIGNGRLLIALSTAVLLYLVFAAHTIAPYWLALPITLFVILVVWHEITVRQRQRAERAGRYYQRGLDRLEDRWMGQGEPGERFRHDKHPYADDLDVFGRGSLFELLSTVRTSVGEETLASWLMEAAQPAEVRARQEAVTELRSRLALREELALLGEDVRAGLHPAALIAWAGAPPVAFPGWARPMALILVAATLTLVLLTSHHPEWPLSLALLALLAQMGFAFSLRPHVLRVLADLDLPGRDLALLAGVLARLERESFTSSRLRTLQERLKTGDQPPSREIARLRRLLELLDSRRNAFFAPVAALLLWGTHFALSLEQWRRAHGAIVPEWLRALGEMEALTALSGYAYEHPGDPFPIIEEHGAASFASEDLGHPLLPESRCVRNSVTLDKHTRLLIVSGSNMSGKSTLLRAVGLNAVLALAGAPVRARTLRLSSLAVGTSLRPQDSLQTGTSRFYAEITRLRDLVELSRRPLPLLFLLDELLSGTNSYDRQRGSAGVLRGLLETPAIGMLTTHDLALAKLADTLPAAHNVHFEDQLAEGVLHFDYQLREGVVQRSNAIELMRSIGLQV